MWTRLNLALVVLVVFKWAKEISFQIDFHSSFSLKWGEYFCLISGAARLQASAVSKTVGGLPSWSVQLDSPGTALAVGGWIRPGGKN